MKKEHIERIIVNLIVPCVIFISFLIALNWYDYKHSQKRLDELMSYCETITGQKHAKFDFDGKFIGCEVVTK